MSDVPGIHMAACYSVAAYVYILSSRSTRQAFVLVRFYLRWLGLLSQCRSLAGPLTLLDLKYEDATWFKEREMDGVLANS